jgi:hypothetical protein
LSIHDTVFVSQRKKGTEAERFYPEIKNRPKNDLSPFFGDYETQSPGANPFGFDGREKHGEGSPEKPDQTSLKGIF